MNPKLTSQKGFTLVEMAMVMGIIALLMAGLLPMIITQMEQQKLSETKRQLNEIQQAIIGFAIIHGRLPCPASSTSNGIESPDGGGACTNFFNGYLPGATLGITSLDENGNVLDAWNNPIRYAVTNWDSTTTDVYTTANGMSSVGISNLNPTGASYYLMVCNSATGITASDCVNTSSRLTALPGVPALIFSTGKNGPSGGTGTDEAANLDGTNLNGNRTFVSHSITAAGTANGEFDDLVIWISNQTLIGRMVGAGKLP